MCGIYGIFPSLMGQDDKKNIINVATNILKNRGPDSQGYWIGKDSEPLLVHTRLALLDQSKNGRQPMKSQSGNKVIVYNGEIYNHKEVRKKLNLKDEFTIFKGSSDTETLLETIDRYEDLKILEEIKGMYAFAIWDRKEEKLSIYRDRFGEKPLYWSIDRYSSSDERLIFSSDLNAIKKTSRKELKINPYGLDEYLRNGFIFSQQTIYQDIFRVTPGSKIEFEIDHKSKSGIKIKQKNISYWSIDNYQKDETCMGKDEDYINKLEALLINVIKETSDADSEIGTLLSGGIDSSLITSLYAKNSKKKIKTFTAVYQEKEFNISKDQYFAREISKQLNTEHFEVMMKGTDTINLLEEIININCEPLADMSQLPVFAISKVIKENNLKAVLSGDGADELFGGYKKYQAIAMIQSFNQSMNNKSKFKFIYDFLNIGLEIRYFNDSYRKEKAIRFLKEVKNNGHIYEAINEIFPEVINQRKSINSKRINYLNNDLKYFMKDDINRFLHGSVLTKVDRATMASSVESRSPFLDERIARFAWNLPENLLVKKNSFKKTTKYILRKLLSKYLNSEITTASKRSFDVPMQDWLRGPLRDMSYDNIQELINRNIYPFDKSKISYVLNSHMNRSRDYSVRIWNLVSLNLWFRKQ